MKKRKAKIKRTNKIEGWDLWKHGVSQSFIGNYLDCRMQTFLKYKQLWTSKTTSLASEFGSCFHWLLSQCYLNKAPKNMCNELIRKYELKWKQENPMPTKYQLENQTMIYGLCMQVLPAYIKCWAGDWTGKYKYGYNMIRPQKWIDIEQRYEIPYTYPDGKKTFFIVVFDGIFMAKGKSWVFETKTKARIDEETLQDTMVHDTQLMLSLLVMKSIFKKTPAGVLYNVVRRPGQRCLKDETLQSFFKRVKKEVSNPKHYDHYFKRWEFAVDWSEVLAWEKTFLTPVMQEIRMWHEGTLATYTNPNALVTKYGRCDLYLPIVKNDFSLCSQRKQYRRNKK